MTRKKGTGGAAMQQRKLLPALQCFIPSNSRAKQSSSEVYGSTNRDITYYARSLTCLIPWASYGRFYVTLAASRRVPRHANFIYTTPSPFIPVPTPRTGSFFLPLPTRPKQPHPCRSRTPNICLSFISLLAPWVKPKEERNKKRRKKKTIKGPPLLEPKE